jgi:MSHA pilin protein MshA
MQKSQKGFTLIELVVVIVLLGILGVTALGKFQNLSLAARNATIQGIAAETTGGSSINYAAAITGLATAVDTSGGTAACTTNVPLLLNAGLPGGYTTADVAGVCAAAGDTYTCSIDHSDTGTTASLATIICSGP